MSSIIYQSELFSVLFLLLPLFIFLYIALQKQRKERLAMYLQKGLQREKGRFSMKVLFLLLAYLAAVIALMEPQAKSENKQVASQELNEIAFVLDVSQSMGAKDGGLGEESRIARAKEIIQQTVQSIGGVNISLYVFQGDLALVVPPTLDYLYFQFALQNETTGSTSISGTDFTAMLKAMKERVIDSSVRKKMRIICLTDGEDTSLFDLLPPALAEKESEKSAYLQKFREAQIPWSMVGVGTTKGSPVPNISNKVTHLVPETLREFQKETNGSSYLAQDLALQDIVDGIVSDVGVERETVSDTFVTLSFYPILCTCLFLIIHLFLREGEKNG